MSKLLTGLNPSRGLRFKEIKYYNAAIAIITIIY